MPHFKSPDGRAHFLSAEDVARGGADLLPPGSVEVSLPEARAIAAQAQPTPDTLTMRAALFAKADVEVNKAEDTGGNARPWRQYRQALRVVDLKADPVVWPTMPGAAQ